MSLAFAIISIAFPRWRMLLSSFSQLFHRFSGKNSVGSATTMKFRNDIGDDKPHHLLLSRDRIGSRVLLIGDVHGCFDELMQLLDKCSHNESNDTLIFVGDLVNKGPKSAETVQWVRTMAHRGLAYCVKGNHDLAAVRMYDSPRQNWPQKYDYLDNVSREDMAWLRGLPYTISIPHLQNALVVHAGLVPGVPLQAQRPTDMTCMRNLVPVSNEDDEWSRGWRPIDIPTEGCPWGEVWAGPQRVYFGHDAKRGLQLQWPMVVGLDTGCCYGRELTACILPGDLIVQVQAGAEYTVGSNRA